MSKRLSIPNKWREKFLEEIFQKYPLFFSSQFKQVKGLKNIKEIFQNKPKMGVHFDTPCANEWRDKYFPTREYVNFLWTFLWNCSFWVCISSPFVQISRGIKKFFKNPPQKRLSQFKQVRGILNPFNRTLTTEYPLPSGDTTPRPLSERIRRRNADRN